MTSNDLARLKCWALVCPPPYWSSYACERPGKFERDGHALCGTHKNAYDKNPAGCAHAWHWTSKAVSSE